MKKLYFIRSIFYALRTLCQLCVVGGVVFTFILSGAETWPLTGIIFGFFGSVFAIFTSLFGVRYCDERLDKLHRRIQRRRRQMTTRTLYKLSYAELMNNFNRHVGPNPKPVRTGRIIGKFQWVSGSLNDNIRTWVVKNGLPHMHTFDGSLWFSETGMYWQTADFEVGEDRTVEIYECVADRDGLLA